MPCNCTFEGIPQDCDFSRGGITRAWIANYSQVAKTASTTAPIGQIATITQTPADSFKLYEFRRQTGYFTSTEVTNEENGTSYVETEIYFQFLRQEQTKRNEIEALSKCDLVIIVEDANGHYWYFGYDRAVRSSTSTGESGTSREDFNGYTITFLDDSNGYPREVSEEAMKSILNPSTGG